MVEQHHQGADKQGGKGQQAEDGGDKNTPYRERHAHQCHALGAGLEDGGNVVEPTHGEGDDKDCQGDQHQQDTPVKTGGPRQDRLGRVEGPARPRGSARGKKARHQHQH